MNKMLVKEKSVEKEKECWVISESYLSQTWCELIRASVLFSLDTLVTLLSSSKIHVRMNVVHLLAFVDSYFDI